MFFALNIFSRLTVGKLFSTISLFSWSFLRKARAIPAILTPVLPITHKLKKKIITFFEFKDYLKI